MSDTTEQTTPLKTQEDWEAVCLLYTSPSPRD